MKHAGGEKEVKDRLERQKGVWCGRYMEKGSKERKEENRLERLKDNEGGGRRAEAEGIRRRWSKWRGLITVACVKSEDRLSKV